MKKIFLISLIFLPFFFCCESNSGNHHISDTSVKINSSNNKDTEKLKTDPFVDSIKVITFKEFQVLFTKYNTDFKLWYFPKLIISNDTLAITGISNENGSELAINKSPNGNFFVLDNIIKDYVENENGEKTLHENFTCVIVNVQEAKVEQSLQSECDGSWNDQNEWMSAGNVVFRPK